MTVRKISEIQSEIQDGLMWTRRGGSQFGPVDARIYSVSISGVWQAFAPIWTSAH
jgi:hypothetical protein